ncbi:MAG TPA: alternative ribosome rescue aminoacyl-tRNA hydrolase ArfB [Pelobium sp.]
MKFNKELLQKEFSFKTSRSGGKGGQNVNKVETKVELLWDLDATQVFTEEEILIISAKLNNRTNSEGVFSVTAEEARSQLKNKEIAVKKAFQLITESLLVQKPRKKSKPSFAAVQKRLDGKRKQALKKINRGTNFD